MGTLGAAIGLLLAATALGCGGDDEAELAIRMNQEPVPGTCNLSQSATEPRIASGVFDLVIGDRSSYVLTPLVVNNGPEDIQVTTARLEAYEERDGASYRLNFACHDPAGCDEWDVDVCGTACPVVPAGGSASFEVQALPRVVTGYYQIMMDAAVRSGRRPSEHDIRTVVRLVGTAGSREVVSAPFSFVTHLCLGCLVEFPPGSDDPAIVGEDCCGAGAPERSCYPGQDEAVDCRLCVVSSPEVCNFGRTSCSF